jgi:hypothetical protein
MAIKKSGSGAALKKMQVKAALSLVNGTARRYGLVGQLLKLLPPLLAREGRIAEQHIREGRFQRSLSFITGFSGLMTGLEVGYEHYRGSYGQRIMYTPTLFSFALFVAGMWGAFNRKAARRVLPIVSLLTMLDGVVGFYYHIRGVQRKPGGWRIPIMNIIMGPPIMAPLLVSTVGFLGLIASLLRGENAPSHILLPGKEQAAAPWPEWLPRPITGEIREFEQDVREGRFQRILAVATACSTFFSWVESIYSHYKNNFSYRIQWTPIIIGPVLMIASIGAIWNRTIARTLLPAASLLAILDGVIGTFYHLRGTLRRPGGLKLPFYNIMYGPPALAPLLFAASGFTGVLASLLRRAK